MLKTLASLVVGSLAVAHGASSTTSTPDFDIWCIGNCETDATNIVTTPGTVLEGGSDLVEEAFQWHITHTNRGDFVVLRASGDDSYNQWIYDISKSIGYELNSVTTIFFKNKKASSNKQVLDRIRNAEGIFFAGGDQGVYVNFWTNTGVQSIVQSKLSSVTVGGTSAGLAIQGQWVYTAVVDSAVSAEAMVDPYYANMNYIVPAFLEIAHLSTFITDTHFVARDRMGRMLSFMARIWEEKSIPAGGVVRGVGVEERTAILLDAITGDSTVVGFGTAYVCTSESKAEVCEPGVPLTFTGIDCVRLDPALKDTYSFVHYNSTGVQYVNSVNNGVLTDPYGPPAAV